MFRLLHFLILIFAIFVNFPTIVGLPSLVRPEQLPHFHILLAWFDDFSIFVIFATFVGPPSLRIAIFACLPCLTCYFRYFCSICGAPFPGPLFAFKNFYSCYCRLLHWTFSLYLLFSLCLLYLWGSLPLFAFKNCYSCCSLASCYFC